MFRQLNEKIFRFERSFIDPHGLPDRLQFKHVIFAPSSSDTYSSAALPGLDSRLSVQNFHWPICHYWRECAFCWTKMRILQAVYDAMYKIDWSDDIATENVKEQFATLRPVLRDCSRSILRLLIRIFPKYFLKNHKKFLHLQRSWKHQNWYGDLKCSKNSDWIKILGIVLLLYSLCIQF